MRMVSSLLKATWVVGVTSLLAHACVPDSGTPRQGRQRNPENELERQGELAVLQQPLMTHGKICGCGSGSNWRDTVQVPDTWPISACLDYCCDDDGDGPDRGIGAETVELGCVLETPPALYGQSGRCGDANRPPIPVEGCGW